MIRMKEDIFKAENVLLNLQYIKIFMSIIIVMYHLSSIEYIPSGILTVSIAKYGYLAADFFFFSSGYCMIKYGPKIYQGKISFLDYIKCRIRKIYPLFVASMVISCIVSYIKNNKFLYDDLWLWLQNLFFMQSGLFIGKDGDFRSDIGGVTWFLGALVLCYIVYYLVNKNDKDYSFVISVILVVIAFTTIGNELFYPVFNQWFMRGIGAFFLGNIFSRIVEEKKNFNSKYLCISIIILFILLRYLLFFQPENRYAIMSFDLVLPNLFIILGFINKTVKCKYNRLSDIIYFFHLPIISVINLSALHEHYFLSLVITLIILVAITKVYYIFIYSLKRSN